MDHHDIYQDTWENEENEWLPYLKNHVLSTAFSYAHNAERMEVLTSFGMKNSLTLPTLASKYFTSLRDEKDEPISPYNVEYMLYFVRKSLKSGRCAALKQY